MKKFIAAAVAALAVTFGASGIAAPEAEAFPFAAENLVAAEADIADSINGIRATYGLNTLGWNQYLSDTSRSWSQVCAFRGSLSHDPMALQIADLENVAVMYHNPRDAVSGWMSSPAHRENILSPYATSIGIGVAKNPATGGYFVTMRGAY